MLLKIKVLCSSCSSFYRSNCRLPIHCAVHSLLWGSVSVLVCSLRLLVSSTTAYCTATLHFASTRRLNVHVLYHFCVENLLWCLCGDAWLLSHRGILFTSGSRDNLLGLVPGPYINSIPEVIILSESWAEERRFSFQHTKSTQDFIHLNVTIINGTNYKL